MKSRVVNFIGGPGVGKSNLAAHLFAELKFEGINAEYIPEYAKWLMWEGRSGKVFAAQDYIFAKQHFSLMRVAREVDIMVTDACLLNTLVYTPDYYPLQSLKAMAVEAFDQYDNLNIRVERSKEYQTAGRKQNQEEAIILDGKIDKMLCDLKIEVHTVKWGREATGKIIKIMQAKKWLKY